MIRPIVALVLGVALCGQAYADDASDAGGSPGNFTISGSIGAAMLQADEYVFNPDGSKGSHLIWESDGVPVATFEAEWRAPETRWALLGSLTLGLTRDSYMEDYDWFDPDRDWTHRSRHPDTDLDRYVALDVGLRYDLLRREEGALGLLGGFRYTDVKWTARGGDYLYTNQAFRDTAGSFPDGEKGISYHQMLPALYLGPTGSLEVQGVTLSASVVGGVSFSARAVDDHWMRDLQFHDDFEPAPYLGVKARADYPIATAVSLFVSTDYERYFEAKASTTINDTVTGESEYIPGDAAGGSFEALRVNAGLSLRF